MVLRSTLSLQMIICFSTGDVMSFFSFIFFASLHFGGIHPNTLCENHPFWNRWLPKSCRNGGGLGVWGGVCQVAFRPKPGHLSVADTRAFTAPPCTRNQGTDRMFC